jgi:hypothetical protein
MMGTKESAMIELTEEQRQELVGAEPASAVDPFTKDEYVLVPAATHDRLKGILDADDAEDMYPLLADIEPADWEDGSVHGIDSLKR